MNDKAQAEMMDVASVRAKIAEGEALKREEEKNRVETCVALIDQVCKKYECHLEVHPFLTEDGRVSGRIAVVPDPIKE